MRLVHFADTHLGFRQFTRTTRDGVNQRESDVEQTFHALVDKVIAINPDVIIIGGDVFHVVRPSNHAIVNAIQEFERLVRSVSSRIVLVAGNHDTPRSTETGGILRSFAPFGIHIVDQYPARIEFDDLSLAVLAVPDVPGLVRPTLAPTPGFQYNVMVMHGEVEGMLPAASHGDRSHEIPTDAMHAAQWDYVGLGHWHVYRELAPNMFYSGSIDYTSSNPWGEMAEERSRGLLGKGFVERDLGTGAQIFHPLPCSRRLVELPAFSAQGMTCAEADSAIRAAVDGAAGGIDGAVVRLVMTEVSRELGRGLDHKALKDYQRAALNFNLDARRPEVTRVAVRGVGRQFATLEQTVASFLADRIHVPDVDPTDLAAMANAYLAQTIDPAEDDMMLARLLESSVSSAEAQAA